MTQISANDVANYLQQHPDFFHDHVDLLEQLSVPHPSGAAVSLVTKQLELLRNKHREQEERLTELIEMARNNDLSCSRLHQLTLALLNAATLAEVMSALETVLKNNLDTDFVEIRLIRACPNPAWSQWFIAPYGEESKVFMRELGSGQIKCARPTLAQAKVLFGDLALEVNSCAIIPMKLDEAEGILAIASRETGRFHYSRGQSFLHQLGELVSARLVSLLRYAV